MAPTTLPPAERPRVTPTLAPLPVLPDTQPPQRGGGRGDP